MYVHVYRTQNQIGLCIFTLLRRWPVRHEATKRLKLQLLRVLVGKTFQNVSATMD